MKLQLSLLLLASCFYSRVKIDVRDFKEMEYSFCIWPVFFTELLRLNDIVNQAH